MNSITRDKQAAVVEDAVKAVKAAAKAGASDEAIAARIPTTSNTVRRWRLGDVKPGYFMALEILRKVKS